MFSTRKKSPPQENGSTEFTLLRNSWNIPLFAPKKTKSSSKLSISAICTTFAAALKPVTSSRIISAAQLNRNDKVIESNNSLYFFKYSVSIPFIIWGETKFTFRLAKMPGESLLFRISGEVLAFPVYFIISLHSRDAYKNL